MQYWEWAVYIYCNQVQINALPDSTMRGPQCDLVQYIVLKVHAYLRIAQPDFKLSGAWSASHTGHSVATENYTGFKFSLKGVNTYIVDDGDWWWNRFHAVTLQWIIGVQSWKDTLSKESLLFNFSNFFSNFSHSSLFIAIWRFGYAQFYICH